MRRLSSVPSPASRSPSAAAPTHVGAFLAVVTFVALTAASPAWLSPAAAQEPRPDARVEDSTVEGPARDGEERGWLGIAFRRDRAPGGARTPRDVAGEGVMISGVLRGSPADRTGIRPGDVLLSVEGERVGPEALAERARDIRVGDSLSLTVRGSSGVRQVVLVAGERPEHLPYALDPEITARLDSIEEAMRRRLESIRERMRAERGREDAPPLFRAPPGDFDSGGRPGRTLRPGAPSGIPSFGRPPRPYSLGAEFVAGARMAALNPSLAEYFEVERGVLTVEVLEGSPAADAGLRPGDVIVSVGEREIGSVEDLRQALLARRGPGVELGIVRKGEELGLELPL